MRSQHPSPKDSKPVLVSALMSTPPVFIDARALAYEADRLAEEKHVHQLLAVEDGALKCVVCRCDLALAHQREPVGALGRSSVVYVKASTSAVAAARKMVERGVGCLPVLDAHGELVGILTRGDLRRDGFFSAEHGVDLCTSCGTGHHLRAPGGMDAPAFCLPCLSATPSAGSAESEYFTLGGSG